MATIVAAAPDLFLDELEAAFTLIGSAPNVGHPYRRSPVGGTRRVLLARTRNHVYDVPLDDEVVVLAVWHARRGSGPPLRLAKVSVGHGLRRLPYRQLDRAAGSHYGVYRG